RSGRAQGRERTRSLESPRPGSHRRQLGSFETTDLAYPAAPGADQDHRQGPGEHRGSGESGISQPLWHRDKRRGPGSSRRDEKAKEPLPLADESERLRRCPIEESTATNRDRARLRAGKAQRREEGRGKARGAEG